MNRGHSHSRVLCEKSLGRRGGFLGEEKRCKRAHRKEGNEVYVYLLIFTKRKDKPESSDTSYKNVEETQEGALSLSVPLRAVQFLEAWESAGSQILRPNAIRKM